MNLKGVKTLGKVQQKEIFGGGFGSDTIGGGGGGCSNQCEENSDCGPMRECFTGYCDGADTKMCRNA